MLGLNDRLPIRDGAPAAKGAEQTAQEKDRLRPIRSRNPADGNAAQRPVPGGLYDFHTDQWADLYVKRIDAMIAALKTKGVPILWVGLPALRGPKSTSDMAYLDELYRERAERAGICYVDIWDGFVDDQGRYAVDGPDFEGQIRRLRTADGVHFTKAGAVKLASYVDRNCAGSRRTTSRRWRCRSRGRRSNPARRGPMSARCCRSPSAAAARRARAVLLGAGNQSAPLTSDPLSQKALDRGAAIAAMAGRADDFSWPRPAPSAGRCRAAAGIAVARRTGEKGRRA